MLGALAEVTTRIEFGRLVSSIGYRHPETAHSAQIGHGLGFVSHYPLMFGRFGRAGS